MTMSNDGLSKLIEEIGELGQVCGKVLAYGLGEHPDGKGELKERLEEELADVEASIYFVTEVLELDSQFTAQRAARKLGLFRAWHADVNC